MPAMGGPARAIISRSDRTAGCAVRVAGHVAGRHRSATMAGYGEAAHVDPTPIR
jgi:hypothetical protein